MQQPADDLSSRFRALKRNSLAGGASRDSKGEPALAPEDEQSLEDLLNSLGPEEQWSLREEDSGDVQDLLKEARKTLSSHHSEPARDHSTPEALQKDSEPTEPDYETKTREYDVSAFDLEDEEKASAKDDEEAGHYMSRVLAEIDVQKKYASDDENQDATDSDQARNRQKLHGVEDLDSGDLDLPSIPTKPLQSWHASDEVKGESTREDGSTADLEARFASLSLPSVPNTAPKSKASTLPKHTDEEIESWCVICLDDATVKCLGCDGDLYCVNCWKEGHRGPDAGLEEKRHRAVAFSRKKKMAAA